ncbi:MAG: glycerate kinase, partial [Ferruginibacter sp.]|nr:glycerate kinase [Cytophagales bacterium]
LADGGDGTAAILTHHARGQLLDHPVHDPLFRPVRASFGLSADGSTAFIEMAQASGLHLLAPAERNCFRTTSLGTGELIARALELGATRLVLGIGGSATNDGGMGMAAALGYRFLDAAGGPLSPVGSNLIHLARVDDAGLRFNFAAVDVRVACDVDNPLTGPEGASRVYGPQKGASAGEIEQLDAGLKNFARVVERQFGKAVEHVPGAGAAGGMGAGAILFLNARLVSGTELVLEQTGFEKQLEEVQLVITGEGKIDGQSLRGKLIQGIVERAARRGIPVAALCGILEATPGQIKALGLQFAASILREPCSLETAMQRSYEGLCHAAFNLVNLYTSGVAARGAKNEVP